MQNDEIKLENGDSKTITINGILELTIKAKLIENNSLLSYFFTIESIDKVRRIGDVNNDNPYKDSLLLEVFDIHPEQYIVEEEDNDYNQDDNSDNEDDGLF